jgi:diguanylate cyclase (GGDEF)-like protein/PAS domain S-box-containing protein
MKSPQPPHSVMPISGIGLRENAEKHLAQIDKRYRGMLEAAPNAMVVVNQGGEIVLLNVQAEKQFGYYRDELIGMMVTTIIPEGFAERLTADGSPTTAETLQKQIVTESELTGQRKDGSKFPIELTMMSLKSDNEILVMAAIHDMSVRKMDEFEEKEHAQVTLNSIGDAVICADVAGNLTFLNVVAEKLTGWSKLEATGRPIIEVFQILDATSRKTIANPMERSIQLNQTVHLPSNAILIRRDGIEIAIDDSVAPIHDREGKVAGVVIVCRDVSVARAKAIQMAHAAEHDFLTGLPNRILFNDRLSQAIASARRYRKHVAVLFLDLDGFKHINDSLGHPIGDKLLQSISKRLIGCVRESDTVSRRGGDEFVVLLSEVHHAEDAAIIAKKMLQEVAETHPINQRDLHITASIGVSVFPGDGQNAETLIKNADTAMYQAKEDGPQTYQFFTPAMNFRAAERQSIEESLRHALERKEFALHYQPIIDLKTGAITRAEALLRWTHPARGPISPAQFIPVAENCGLIMPIGAWVLREACKQARSWMDKGLAVKTMAANVSPIEFQNEYFLDNLFAILEETGMDPKCLELELTEKSLINRDKATASTLNTLRKKGVKVAIDDFGTGYSSLSYLRKFPLDALKIDRTFIRQISTAGEDRTIVTAGIGMGKNLRMRVVAEGVETLEELEFLRAQQCDEAQGYFFSRPMPPRQFAGLLKTGIPKISHVGH